MIIACTFTCTYTDLIEIEHVLHLKACCKCTLFLLKFTPYL